jgi:dihydrofolate synthase/folylpolyglutamate synthase
LDATNVVEPVVSIITAISLDHTAILGDTVPEIAWEKAGVIKSGVPVVVGPQPPEALAVIAAVAAERGSRLYRADADWIASGDWRSACFVGPWGSLCGVSLALAGAHQVDNTGVALAALSLVGDNLLRNLDVVSSAIGDVRWPGRFEVVGASPAIILDGAHNVESIERLVTTIQAEYPGQRSVVVLGTSRDKDADGILHALAKLGGPLITVQSHNPRALDARSLAERARSAGIVASAFEHVGDALDAARDDGTAADVILVTGSLYVVAEAREALGLAVTSNAERQLLYG